MAKVDKIRGESIELLRGKIDFYLLRGILPVARSWPKKPKPPYTELQAEAMAVFSIACKLMSRLSDHILKAWRIGSEGKRQQWTDTFKGLFMEYWKLNKVLSPMAIDYKITEEETKFTVEWTILRVYLKEGIPEVMRKETTDLIKKEDISKMKGPIYFTLYDEVHRRLVAPYILLEV